MAKIVSEPPKQSWVREFPCPNCQATIEADQSDLHQEKRWGRATRGWVKCPLCEKNIIFSHDIIIPLWALEAAPPLSPGKDAVVLSWELYSRSAREAKALRGDDGWSDSLPCPKCGSVISITEADLSVYKYWAGGAGESAERRPWFECPQCQIVVILHTRVPEEVLLASPVEDPRDRKSVELSAEMVNRFREGRPWRAGE
jgi:predicted RNA-binding Zn-ribbon protein involved in translation (DUF1610 family)